MEPMYFALPAILALAAKGVIYLYARFAELRTPETRLYLWFLFALAIQNLAEIGIFTAYAAHLPYIYFSASIVAIALLLHLAFAIAHDVRLSPAWFTLLYAPALLLEALLWFSPLLVQGFEPLRYTYTRQPGPAYFLFELYALGYVGGAAALFLIGARRAPSAIRRTKNRLMVLGLSPIVLVVISVVTLQHFGSRAFNTTVTLPIAVTFFLAVTAYATHQYRLFDIGFYLPWSKIRKRKTAFYARIRAMIAEIADLGSVRDAVTRLADTLRCPVALISTGNPVLAAAGGAQRMASFPVETLHKFDRIVVADEIAVTAPDSCALMRRHGVAAIVPFYPHSQNASGWMLLGDTFSEQVYTPLDFKMVEQLFDKLAELFLDKLLAMRAQIAASKHRLQATTLRLQQAEAGMTALRSEVEILREQNLRLAREQVADSLAEARAPEHGTLPGITLLGRDKPLLKRLRRYFPQADQYVGPDSTSFRRQALPEVLIGRLDEASASVEEWRSLLTDAWEHAAFLFYGDTAPDFLAACRDTLTGALVDRLPVEATDEALVRRIQAIAELRRAVFALPNADSPLVGTSLSFRETMHDLTRLAGFTESLLIESGDARERTAVAQTVHQRSGRAGVFLATTAQALIADAGQLAQTLQQCAGGSLLVDELDRLAPAEQTRLLAAIPTAGAVRVLVGTAQADAELRARFGTHALRLPTLRERRQDLPALVHYFTLQYNLRAGTQAYLTQADVDELMATNYPETLEALKMSVFDRLHAQHRNAGPESDVASALAGKTLDEHVAEFEARLIEQTLRHCQGNKSKAARLLGLRPNTLHYKLERYGLGGVAKKPE